MQNDKATTTEPNNSDTIGSIVLGDENYMQHDGDICEFDSNKLQQKPLFKLHVIVNVTLEERQKCHDL